MVIAIIGYGVCFRVYNILILLQHPRDSGYSITHLSFSQILRMYWLLTAVECHASQRTGITADARSGGRFCPEDRTAYAADAYVRKTIIKNVRIVDLIFFSYLRLSIYIFSRLHFMVRDRAVGLTLTLRTWWIIINCTHN